MLDRVRSTFSALTQNWKQTQKVYPWLPLEVGGLFVGVVALVAIPVSFINLLTALLIAIPAGLLAAMFWFSRRAMRAAYKSIEGQPGAAPAVIGSLRGDWLVTPAVAISRTQDMVSRVVGKPGVILVSEGPSARVAGLLATERKKTARWAPEIPIYEIQVGDEAGQVSLMKLQRALTKLPRNLRGREITELRKRLDAVSSAGGGLPIPKGPMPTSSRQVRRQR